MRRAYCARTSFALTLLGNGSHKSIPCVNSLSHSVESEIYQCFCCDSDCLNSSTTSKIAFLSKPVEKGFNGPESSIKPLGQPICACSVEEDAVAQWQHDIRFFASIILLVDFSIGSLAYRLRIQAPKAGTIRLEPLSSFALVSNTCLFSFAENIGSAVA
jgi:hypothetical protein